MTITNTLIMPCSQKDESGEITRVIGTPAEWLQFNGPTLQMEIGFDASQFPKGGTAPEKNALPQLKTVLAVIDTGAATSCIDDSLAVELKLPPINKVPVAGVGGAHTLTEYLAKISIPSLNFSQIGSFIGADLSGGGQIHHALIGRDVLQKMVLVYDGIQGIVKLAI